MTRRTTVPACLLACAGLLACGAVRTAPSGSEGNDHRKARLIELARGLAVRAEDPAAAAAAFARAGPGSELEILRFELWPDALQRSDADPAAWKILLSQHPPEDVADDARAAITRRLLSAGRLDEAETVLRKIKNSVLADSVRLRWPDRLIQIQAARRLAIAAPSHLRREAPELERMVAPTLEPTEAIARAVAWRTSGSPNTSASELRRLKVAPELRTTLRLERARSELARGSASAALAILPRLDRCDGEEALLRASCRRRLGWAQFPGKSAEHEFRFCVAATRRAEAQGVSDRMHLLETRLECSTEAGALQTALSAWDRLERENRKVSRRSWLGRRLGVALARSGRFSEGLGRLIDSLEYDERCLRFTLATSPTPVDRNTLNSLAQAPIADIYGLWSREILGMTAPPALVMPKPLAHETPPPTVAWLLDRNEPALASREWRRWWSRRHPSPGEALTASRFEDGRGRPDLAIRWLRRGFSDLGGTRMDRVPENVVEAYLPLRWHEALRSAAREFDLDPWLLAGLARQESIFNATARSPAGARGAVQLLPGTARGHALALGLGRSPDLFDPKINLRLGARELARLIRKFGAVEPALAAYNAGERRVRAWWKRSPNRYVFTESIPIPETYSYVRRVRFLAEAYRRVRSDAWKNSTVE